MSSCENVGNLCDKSLPNRTEIAATSYTHNLKMQLVREKNLNRLLGSVITVLKSDELRYLSGLQVTSHVEGIRVWFNLVFPRFVIS